LLATSSGDGGWEERRRGVAYIGEGSKGGPGFGSRDLTRLEFLVGAAGRGPLVGSLVSVATRQRVEAGMDRARLDGIDSVVSSCELGCVQFKKKILCKKKISHHIKLAIHA
jgi:hypothetical protein